MEVFSLLVAYLVLILGSIVFHAFALVISLIVGRFVATVAVVLFLIVVGVSSFPVNPLFHLGPISPFVAGDIARQITWHLQSELLNEVWEPHMTDLFFRWPVHHVLVLIILYTTFTAWFLLALVRNIKRDPTVYELLTAPQALGLALYVSLLLIGFFRWSSYIPLESEAIMLSGTATLFWWLGLVLLRNRDRLRRFQAGEERGGWSATIWPAPYVLAGFSAVGLAIVAYAGSRGASGATWNLALGLYQMAILSLWLVRDVLYLQWMILRRGRRSLLSAILYLIVFNVAVSILIVALRLVETRWGLGLSMTLLPPMAVGLKVEDWIANRWVLLIVLAVQAAGGAFFATLHSRRIAELSPPRPVPALA